jgi:hypothetical protein
LLYFFRVSLFDHILHLHSHAGWVNHAVDLLATVLVEFKAFDLFALTFGIGVAIQAERAELRGVRSEAFLVRRFLVLFGLGLCHMLLVSNVDILTLYAVCGLLSIPLLRLPTAVLAMAGLIAPVKLSCADHEGASKVRIQQWDGKKWAFISEWLTPDQKLLRPMVEESAAKYAKEKNITPRDCAKES